MKSVIIFLVAVLLQCLFAYGIWKAAQLDREVEVIELKERLEDCQWHLLERNAELETLKQSND
jgi:uncharacterized protein YxeA